jgi:hypothetical protein
MGKPVTLYSAADLDMSPAAAFPTYMAATGPITPAATPTDIFQIGGSASKIIRVRRIFIDVAQTSDGTNNWFLIKRSAANSGGTAVNATKIPLDSGDAAATAIVRHYTANPTPGAAVGNLLVRRVGSPSAGSGGYVPNGIGLVIDFVKDFGRPIVLRGVAESIVWNFNGAAVPAGMTVQCGGVWTETSD